MSPFENQVLKALEELDGPNAGKAFTREEIKQILPKGFSTYQLKKAINRLERNGQVSVADDLTVSLL